MGRFADVIRCHILEKYMSSYMRERNVHALLVLRNEDEWAMTGNFLLFGNFVSWYFSFCYFFFGVIFYAVFCFSR